jgi:hypothetical protein
MSKIIQCSLEYQFQTDSGYECSEHFSNGPTAPHSVPLRAALGSLVRTLILNGEEELVHKIVADEIEQLKLDEEESDD